MSASAAKKLRKQIRTVVTGDTRMVYLALNKQPFRNRVKLAWQLLRGKLAPGGEQA